MLFPGKSEKDREKKREFKGKKILKGIWKKREVDYVSGEILLKLRSAAGAEDAALVGKLFSGNLKNAKIIRKFDRFGIGLIDAGAQIDVLKECEALLENPNVEYAEPNMIDRVAVTIPNDPSYSQQWSLPLINAPDAWDLETGKSDVLIAVLDSGIPMNGTPLSLSHPDLNDTSRIILGTDHVNNNVNPRDDCGHGTHVTGIASANSNNAIGIAGLSWGSRIYVVKIFDADGNGSSQLFYDGVIEAVDYAVSHNLRLVINYSGGGPPSETKRQAVQYARDRNCLIVAAAGNDYSSAVIYPAAYSTSFDNVIAVSATDANDAFAAYSNKGPEINVAAPGTHIFSTMPNYNVTLNNPPHNRQQIYDYLDGTSMATPHVSGLAALILSRNDTLSTVEVRDIIESQADDLGNPSWDEYYGYGRIDAYQSLNATLPQPCGNLEGFGPRECLVPVECIVQCIKEGRVCKWIREPIVQCRDKCEFISELRCRYCEYKIEAFMCQRDICFKETIGPICPAEGVTIGPRECVNRRIYPQGKSPAMLGTLKHVRPLTKRGPLSHKKRYYTRG